MPLKIRPSFLATLLALLLAVCLSVEFAADFHAAEHDLCRSAGAAPEPPDDGTQSHADDHSAPPRIAFLASPHDQPCGYRRDASSLHLKSAPQEVPPPIPILA